MFLTTPSITWPSASVWTRPLRCSARVSSRIARHAAFALQADVDHRQVILDPSDGALHHLAFKGFVLAAEAFVEKGLEIVAGREYCGRHKFYCLSYLNRACRVPRHHGEASHADL